jgi:hypothetical protein
VLVHAYKGSERRIVAMMYEFELAAGTLTLRNEDEMRMRRWGMGERASCIAGSSSSFFLFAEKLEIIQFFGVCCWLQLLLLLLLLLLLFSLFEGDDGGE